MSFRPLARGPLWSTCINIFGRENIIRSVCKWLTIKLTLTQKSLVFRAFTCHPKRHSCVFRITLNNKCGSCRLRRTNSICCDAQTIEYRLTSAQNVRQTENAKNAESEKENTRNETRDVLAGWKSKLGKLNLIKPLHT